MATVVEQWPGGEDGIHPRADEYDGDLGERAGALGRLVNQVPGLVATVGWGGTTGDEARAAAALALRETFGRWTNRFEVAFGSDLPSSGEAWRSLQTLVGTGVAASTDRVEAEAAAAPPPTDAWDLIDQALARMMEQDHHSPAVPVLRLLASWRSGGIIDIVERMRPSGVTFEQLMASVKQQTTDG